MKNVVDRLVQYSKEIELKERFDYGFEISNTFFSQSEISELSNCRNVFEQNVKLKWIIKEKYNLLANSTEIDFWIINDWGGIRGFKENDRNIEKIKAFKKQLDKERLTLDTFSTISSLSKLSSFLDPDKYVIYDSRVIYALNYLILSCENKNGFKQKYFPMPSGRNKKITDFDMNTIINIFHADKYVTKSELIIPQQQAYFDFCNFIKTHTKTIYGSNAKPYELEMLLFTIADREIFYGIKENLELTIKNYL